MPIRSALRALALALALWFAPSARAQPVIQTTAYTRGLLIQATAAACRAYLGITNGTSYSIIVDTNGFGVNFDTSVFFMQGSTNLTLQGAPATAGFLPLTNVLLNGATTVRRVALGNAGGTLTVDPSLADEFSLTLTNDLTLGFTLSTWGDGHNVRLRAANTGNFTLTFTNVAYWYPTGNSTQVTNDWGAGTHNSFAFWKDAGSLYASDKEGIGVSGGSGTTINPTDGRIPYRSGATTFGDSPLLRVNATTIGLNSSTNLLTTSGADLVYSNHTAATAFKVQNGTNTAAMGIEEITGQPYFQGNDTGVASQPTFGFGGSSGYYHAPNIHLWSEGGVQIARLYYNNTPFLGAGSFSLGAGAIYFGGSPQAFTNSISSGQGTPEGVLAQPTGSFYLDRAGAAYVKATGTGNTGWTALGGAAFAPAATRFATSTNYTLTAANYYVVATATLTNTLPAASAVTGKIVIIKNKAGTTTVRPAGSDTIDGVAGDDVFTGKISHTFISDGVSNWELN